MYSLALIIFVVSEKKAFKYFPIGSNVNLPYFTDYWSMGTIGRIAAFRLNFWGNTKIGRSIP